MKIPFGAGSILTMISGLIVWASCFVVLYVGLSLGCAYNVPAFEFAGLPGVNWMLLALWLAHIGVLTGLAIRALRHWRQTPRQAGAPRFALRTAFALQLVGLLGSVWIGFPILMLPACA